MGSAVVKYVMVAEAVSHAHTVSALIFVMMQTFVEPLTQGLTEDGGNVTKVLDEKSGDQQSDYSSSRERRKCL